MLPARAVTLPDKSLPDIPGTHRGTSGRSVRLEIAEFRDKGETVRRVRSGVFAGAFASAIAIVVVAGCTSRESGAPAAATTIASADSAATSSASAGPTPPVSSGVPSSPTTAETSTTVSAAVSSAPVSTITVTATTASRSPVDATTGSSVSTTTENGAVRITTFDASSGRLTYVDERLIDPVDVQPYYADDPNDSAQHRALLAPNAQIRFVFTFCRPPYGELTQGGVGCGPDDLAAAVAHGHFIAKLGLVDGSIVTVHEVFQS